MSSYYHMAKNGMCASRRALLSSDEPQTKACPAQRPKDQSSKLCTNDSINCTETQKQPVLWVVILPLDS